MLWKGPFKVDSSTGVNDYCIKVGEKLRTFQVHLLKKHVECETEIESRVKAQRKTEEISESPFKSENVFQVTGASIIELGEGCADEAVDDNDLLELGSTVSKELVVDVTFGEQLNEDQRKQAEELVGLFEALFTDKSGSTDVVEHEIKLTSDEPIRLKPYAIPFNVRESLKSDIKNMLDMGVIRESKSPYASERRNQSNLRRLPETQSSDRS